MEYICDTWNNSDASKIVVTCEAHLPRTLNPDKKIGKVHSNPGYRHLLIPGSDIIVFDVVERADLSASRQVLQGLGGGKFDFVLHGYVADREVFPFLSIVAKQVALKSLQGIVIDKVGPASIIHTSILRYELAWVIKMLHLQNRV